MTKIALQIKLENYSRIAPTEPLPVITSNKTELEFESTEVGNVSASETIVVSGINLTAPIIITAPAGLICNTNNSNTNQSPLSLPETGGVVDNTTVYFKLVPTDEETYSGNITATSTGAATKTIAYTGEGLPEPSIILTASPLTVDFDDTWVNFLSESQLITINATGLSSDAIFTAPAGYIANTNNGIENESPITIPHTGGNIVDFEVFLIFAPTADTTYNANATLSATGATTVNIALTGEGVINYFIDEYTGGEALGYSLDALKDTSTRSVLLQRDIDDEELDLDFTFGMPNEAALQGFINGSNKVYVLRCYNQIGSNDLVFNPAASELPYIVDGGVITRDDFGNITFVIPTGVESSLVTPVPTANNFTCFTVIQSLAGATTFGLYSPVAGVPVTPFNAYPSKKYYTQGEDGYIESIAAYPELEPVLITGIYNASLKKQYKNGVEIPSNYVSYGATFANPLTGSLPNGACYFNELILYLSDKSADKAAMESNRLKRYGIIQTPGVFSIERLTPDAGLTGIDSTLFIPFSNTELAMFGAFGNYPLTGNRTNKWWLTTDGANFTEQASLMPTGGTSHVVSGTRLDGLIWMFSSHNPDQKFFVVNINPLTSTWTTISLDVAGLQYMFAQWGFFHKNFMYGAFGDGLGGWVLKRSSDGLTWTDTCALPAHVLDSCAWSDGNIIRFAGGGDSGNSDRNDGVYESTDDGFTINLVSLLPLPMRTVWPNYTLYNGYEIYINGAFSSAGSSEDGQFYYRPLGSGPWAKSSLQDRKFNVLGRTTRHACAHGELSNELYVGFGALPDTFKITLTP